MEAFLWVDIAGTTLTQEDRDVLSHSAVSGIILFSRNYASPHQLKDLTQAIRQSAPKIQITVDQEGGRVQRFREGFTELPSMQYWGERYRVNPTATKTDFSAMLHTTIQELRDCGVDRTLIPVLDIDYGHNTVIGHRAFGHTADIVSELGEFVIDTCHALQMPVTAKHFPGHGYVAQDSHTAFPVDTRSYGELAENDLKPFQRLSSKIDAMMLAHVVYSAVDPNPATFSPFWVKTVLRERLGFRVCVMTDDLSMQAASMVGDYPARVSKALAAGCDTLLICNAREGVLRVLD